jgi:DNA (cytosine-5)-methyltransferase 1
VNVLDLFSGIGGFSLGLERAGMRTVAFCEIDPYARAVLRKHWPDVPCYDDVRTLTADRLAADGIRVDVICGGFPCQDISNAGAGAGLDGERSGLYREALRLVGSLRPRHLILENVSALLSRGLGEVLGDLAEIGYDAEWHCIPASALGAPHRRDRVWIMAYPSSDRREVGWVGDERRGAAAAGGCDEPTGNGSGDHSQALAYAERERQPRPGEPLDPGHPAPGAIGQAVDALYGGIGAVWSVEPDVGRVANGIPSRVDRLRCLGNAVVPQIPELIGRAIMRTDEATGAT